MNFKVIGLILVVAILLNVLLWLQTEPFRSGLSRMTTPANNYNRQYSSSSDSGLPIWAIVLVAIFGVVIVGLIIMAAVMIIKGDTKSLEEFVEKF
jgi:RsiW-degrading membrane proteinase PrsW (M82 family)